LTAVEPTEANQNFPTVPAAATTSPWSMTVPPGGNLIKTVLFVADGPDKKARVFGPWRGFST
jgi:hypothetical protein